MDVIYGHGFDTDAPNIFLSPCISSVWITAWVGTICPLFSVARMGHFKGEKKIISVRISWTMQIVSSRQRSHLKTGIKSLFRLSVVQSSLGLLC